MSDLATKETLEQISEIQTEIDRLNESSSEEIINVEKKYNKLRKPVFQKRQVHVKQVQNVPYNNQDKILFWRSPKRYAKKRTASTEFSVKTSR